MKVASATQWEADAICHQAPLHAIWRLRGRLQVTDAQFGSALSFSPLRAVPPAGVLCSCRVAPPPCRCSSPGLLPPQIPRSHNFPSVFVDSRSSSSKWQGPLSQPPQQTSPLVVIPSGSTSLSGVGRLGFRPAARPPPPSPRGAEPLWAPGAKHDLVWLRAAAAWENPVLLDSQPPGPQQTRSRTQIRKCNRRLDG